MTDGPHTCTPSRIAVRAPIVTPGSMIAVGWMLGASAAARPGATGPVPAPGCVRWMVTAGGADAPAPWLSGGGPAAPGPERRAARRPLTSGPRPPPGPLARPGAPPAAGGPTRSG